MSEYRITASGTTVHMGPDQVQRLDARLDGLLRSARATGSHVWVALLAFAVDPAADEPIFDSETLVSQPTVGCYRCEQPWTKRTRERRCPGDAT